MKILASLCERCKVNRAEIEHHRTRSTAGMDSARIGRYREMEMKRRAGRLAMEYGENKGRCIRCCVRGEDEERSDGGRESRGRRGVVAI